MLKAHPNRMGFLSGIASGACSGIRLRRVVLRAKLAVVSCGVVEKLKWVLTDTKTCDIIKKRSFENEKIYKFFVSFNALCIF